MSSNAEGRRLLQMIYGKGCMFKKAHIEEQVEALRTIKTYKRFLRETKYTSKKVKKLESNITYHHLKHKSEGGNVSIENGSLINELAHRYIHSLPRKDEEVINDMLREYKLSGGILIPQQGLVQVEQPFSYDIDFSLDTDYMTIPAYDNIIEDEMCKKQKFNRAKIKRKTKQLVDEELDYMEDIEK